MRKINCLLFVVSLLFAFHTAKAEEISLMECILENQGIPNLEMLFDGDQQETQLCPANSQLTLHSEDGFGSLYLIFDREYGAVMLTDETGEEFFLQTEGILHYYADLEVCFGHAPQTLTVSFSDGEASVNELYLFPPGPVPDWVQQWQRIPDGGADLLLCSTHGDDEQLFFAGLLPWYGAEKGYAVQVVYFTDHRNLTPHRVHEMLNGLWNVGIRNYPVFGPYDDYYTFDMQDAYRYYENAGSNEAQLLSFVVEQLRRYRPKVAVGHDVAGEYGHGMHKLYTDLLMKAVEVSADATVFPELAEKYGTWDVPKTYLHLYGENPITMDWDVPLESFDGKTAYEVTRDLGFPSHVSQQRDFAWYFRNAEKAVDVAKYSPCRYGLYRSTVGEDVEKNDFFENISEPQPPKPETIPEPTQEVMVQEPQPVQEKQVNTVDRHWIVFPAVGTAVLAVMTVTLSLPAGKEKFSK